MHALPCCSERCPLTRHQLHAGLQVVHLVGCGCQVYRHGLEALQPGKASHKALKLRKLCADGLHTVADLTMRAGHRAPSILGTISGMPIGRCNAFNRIAHHAQLLPQALLCFLRTLARNTIALQNRLGSVQGLLLLGKLSACTMGCSLQPLQRCSFLGSGWARLRDLTPIVGSLPRSSIHGLRTGSSFTLQMQERSNGRVLFAHLAQLDGCALGCVLQITFSHLGQIFQPCGQLGKRLFTLGFCIDHNADFVPSITHDGTPDS